MFKRFLCGILAFCLWMPVIPVTGDEVVAEPPPETAPLSTGDPVQGPVDPVVPISEDPIPTPVVEAPTPVLEPPPQVEPAPEPSPQPIVEPNPSSQPIATLAVNEVMAGTEINPTKDSWVELFNPTDKEIVLTGWQIRGVTEGGSWINLGDSAIPSQGFFLMSYYTNSRYSALAVAPQLQKSSLLFPNPAIRIELKNPEEQIVDSATLDREPATDYRSFERARPIGDGSVAESWRRADCRRSVKESAALTFGSPGDTNCQKPTASNEPPAPTDTQTVPDSTDTFPQNPASGPTEGSAADGAPVSTDPPSAETPAQPNQPPIAVIRTQQWTRGMDLNVTGEDSSDPDGDRLGFMWAFEPGITDNRENPAQYHFTVPGEKTVTLTVTDEHGASVSTSIMYVATQPVVMVAQSVRMEPSQSAKSYNWGDVVVTSALPNPTGKDEGQEVLVLRNRLSVEVDLSGWAFENSKRKRADLPSLKIGPDASIELKGSDIGFSLVNSGDKLVLLDAAGNKIDEFSWDECKEGQVVLRPEWAEGEAEVTRVVDGDTFHAEIDGRDWSVRLIGVDAPETIHPLLPPQPYGKEASDYLKQRLEGQSVELEFEGNKTDIYGRLLALVTLDGRLINAELLEDGYARAYLKFPFRLQDEFHRLEEQAKAAKVGLWGMAAEKNIDSEASKEPQEKMENKEGDMENILESGEAATTIPPECATEGLVIDSIAPNMPKGGGVEWIRLFNPTDKTVCLKGWSLDDQTDGGSKPFAIRGGAMASEAFRTFRKTETHLSLNNENDCATLINPLEKTVDAICYTQAHPNEQITHAGGSWKPKTRVKKAMQTVRKTAKKSKSETVSLEKYLEALSTETLQGTVTEIDAKEKTLYLIAKIPVSFGQSGLDPILLTQTIEVGGQVKVDIRQSGKIRELVSLVPIRTAQTEAKSIPKKPKWPWVWPSGVVLAGVSVLAYRRKKKI